jgi:hypothetical protein
MNQPSESIRDQIRTELAAMRPAFLELMAMITPADLNRPSANPAWRVKELLFHIILSLDYLPREVRAARQGKNLMPMPQPLYDRLIIILTRLGSLPQTDQSLLAKFEAAHQAALACLDGIEPTEWQKPIRFFYVDATIEELFRRQPRHFAEHAAQIKTGLGLRK